MFRVRDKPDLRTAPDVERDFSRVGPLPAPAGGAGPAALHLRAGRRRQAGGPGADRGGAGPDGADPQRARLRGAPVLLAAPVRPQHAPGPGERARDPGQGPEQGQGGVRGQHRQGDQRRHPAAGLRLVGAGQGPHPGRDRRGPGAGRHETQHGAAPGRPHRGRRRDVARPAREPARAAGAAEEGLRGAARVDPDQAGQAGGPLARAGREAGQRAGGVPGRPVLRRLDAHAPRRRRTPTTGTPTTRSSGAWPWA